MGFHANVNPLIRLSVDPHFDLFQHGFKAGSRPFFYHEVIDRNDGAVLVSEYFDLGWVTEFRYSKYRNIRTFRRHKRNTYTGMAGEKSLSCWTKYFINISNSVSFDADILNRLQRPFSETELAFVNLTRSPGIDSQPGGPVRNPYLTYRPARLHRLAESIPGTLQRLQIRGQYCSTAKKVGL